MTRMKWPTWVFVLPIALTIVACNGVPMPTTNTNKEIKVEVRPASHPLSPEVQRQHPLPPTPTLSQREVQTPIEIANNTRVIEGYLHVWYEPSCELVPTPAEWVAPIILTDLYSGSIVHLDSNGAVMGSDFKTDKGKAALEAVLKDSSLMEQVMDIPKCPKRVYEPTIEHRGGWPDPNATEIGNPQIPKVAISTYPATSLGADIYPGWRGSYCWPIGASKRECESSASWDGFAAAKALRTFPGLDFYFTILDSEAGLGRISQVQLFTIKEEWSLLKLRTVVELAKEVYSVKAQDGETLETFETPAIAKGVYILITNYESPLGEVEHGFKVELYR